MEKKYKISDEKFNEAIKLIQKNGGTIYNDDTFEISGVEGNFKRSSDGTCRIEITDKPWLASWSMIENKLDEFFSS